uniref:RNA helicase n=1 Tax=Panagrellus redivivus TaxID=6233 RepID=A0A7E4W4H4_PANRE
MSSKELIVVMTDQDLGYVVRRRTKEKIKKSTNRELAEALYAAAPQEKVCAVYVCCLPTFRTIKSLVEALENAGYTNVKTVNLAALRFGHLAEASHLQLRVNDFVAFDTTNEYTFSVYQRMASGYTFLGDKKTIHSGVVVKSKEVKNIIVTEGELSNRNRQDYKQHVPRKAVWFSEDDEYFGIEDIWRLHDHGETRFPEPFTMQIRLRFGHVPHYVDVKYEDLPFQTAFELDIEDSNNLDVALKFNDAEFYFYIESITFENDGTKNQKIRVTIDVPETFIPVVKATVTSKTEKPDYCVYSIDFNDDTKQFSATHVTADGIDEVVDKSPDITKVITALAAHNPSTTLHGVLINYSEAERFPLDAHRSLIEALPSPLPRVLIGPTHTDFSIHLWNAKVNVERYQLVAITDIATNQSSHFPTFFIFQKTKNGFKPCGHEESIHKDCKVLVVIQNEPEVSADNLNWFKQWGPPKMKVIISAISTLPPDIKHKFAWDFFNGYSFHGCTIRAYCGVNINVRGSDLYSLNIWKDSYGGSFKRCAMLDVNDDLDSNGLSFKDSSYLKLGYFDLNPSILLYFIGFRKPLLLGSLRNPKTQMGLLNICIDKNLLPSYEFVESKSMCDILNPHELIHVRIPTIISEIPICLTIANDAEQEYITTVSEGMLSHSMFKDTHSAAIAINQLSDIVEIDRIFDLFHDQDFSKRTARRAILENLPTRDFCEESTRQIEMSLMLNHCNVKVTIGHSIVIFNTYYGHMFLQKCENAFKVVNVIYDNNIRPLFSNYNVKLIIFDNVAPTTVKVYQKKFAPFKCIENTMPLEIRRPLNANVLFNAMRSKYAIDPYDIQKFTISINGGTKQVIHDGVFSVPFEKYFIVNMAGVTNITIDVACHNGEKRLKSYNTADWNDNYYCIFIDQYSFFSIDVTHHSYFVLLFEQSMDIFSIDADPKLRIQKSAATLILQFKDNQINFISMYKDSITTSIEPVPAYFHLAKTEDGFKGLVGAKAKAAMETNPDYVIYDFGNLLGTKAGDYWFDPTWTFKTSRADDNSLLVHLDDDNVTSPLPLFASVVKSALLYAQQFVLGEIDEVFVFFSSTVGEHVSAEEMVKISNVIGAKVNVRFDYKQKKA